MSDESPRPSGRRTLFLCALALLIGALILLLAVEWGAITGQKPAAEPEDQSSDAGTGREHAFEGTTAVRAVVVEPGPTAVRAFASGHRAPPEALPDATSSLAATLHDPAGTPRNDLATLAEILAHFVGEFRELPVGNNAEITAALAGDNARAYAVLPADHPSISREGELLDRWGTPYFFHQFSSTAMEIRSSGPDRRRYTADDVVWPDELRAHEAATLAALGRDEPFAQGVAGE